ncbi:MAG: mechanosensitive ion channel [Brumimicrobium sp.]|nr:mechanosensitive ion channel [Brumimicrobium sp.]
MTFLLLNFRLYTVHIIETAFILLVYFILKYLIRKATVNAANKLDKPHTRATVINKVIHFILLSILIFIVLLIWGVEQSQLVLFLTSLLTVLGIAFFAQWSIISNITAAIIVFFNHPAKIGDTIEMFDKDYPIKGIVHDIGIFFIYIETENGEIMTCPSNLFIQKVIIRRDTKKIAIKDSSLPQQ